MKNVVHGKQPFCVFHFSFSAGLAFSLGVRPMTIRDRILELRRVQARELRVNPKNWRKHPARQQAALRGLLEEIGYAGALLARETDDDALELIDGHLRAETTPDELVPVLVLDVTEKEADMLLATHDPLAAMAETDDEALAALLANLETDDARVEQLLAELAMAHAGAELPPLPPAPEIDIPKLFQVIVDCADEEEQRVVYEDMKAAGRRCRVLVL
jgi:hypothetical protein